jgi:hypothetical protein
MPFTVLTWYGARRARKPLHELVRFELTDRPTLLALVGDKFTQESHIRPFRPLAERFGDRLHVILCAEWEEQDRARDGAALFKSLGVAPDLVPRLLTDDGEIRCGVFLKQRLPVALIDLYFVERGSPTSTGMDDGREPYFLAREEVVAREVERLMARAVPPQALAAAQQARAEAESGLALLSGRPVSGAFAPPQPKTSPLQQLQQQRPQPGAHEFGSGTLCKQCGDGRLSVRACPGKPKDDGPTRDRFELIELE